MAITFTSNLDLKNNRVTNMGAPTAPSDAVTKQYADAITTGIVWKDAVRAGATTNVTLAAPGVVDGVTLADGDRVLLMGQTDAAENGIYVSQGGSLVRSDDADQGLELRSGSAATVTEGTANGNKTFVLITDNPVVIGTTPQQWTILNAGTSQSLIEGDGIDITGGVVSAVAAPTGGLSVGAAGIGAVADPAGGIEIGVNGLGLNVVPDTALLVDVNGLRFVPRPNNGIDVDVDGAGVLIAPDSGLAVDASGVMVVPSPNGGLVVDATGLKVLPGNGLINDPAGLTVVVDPTGGLQVGAAGLGAKLPPTSALMADVTGLSVVAAPAGGLSTGLAGISVDVAPDMGLVVDATGVGVLLRPDDGLDVDAAGIGVLTDPDGGLTTTSTGLAVEVTADSGLEVDNTGLHTVLDPDGGLAADNLGLKVVADPAVQSDPGGPSLIVSATGVAVNVAVLPRKFAQSLGDGAASTFAVNHGLNSLDVVVDVYEVSSGQSVYADITRTDADNVSVDFGSAPTAGQYRAVVLG